jgi:hypothetical protein
MTSTNDFGLAVCAKFFPCHYELENHEARDVLCERALGAHNAVSHRREHASLAIDVLVLFRRVFLGERRDGKLRRTPLGASQI